MWMIENGHRLELQQWSGQGGELENLVIWCHTCDPEGENVMKAKTLNFDGALALKSEAIQHAKASV